MKKSKKIPTHSMGEWWAHTKTHKSIIPQERKEKNVKKL